ncbi:E3 UFM1-protein ligase 1 [Gracilariopsis chorda]|uniref:E3 UFM1-protein ligase 1 n=1 Tax=Gracilariopsis chorda TaxID=448386 RepID=A0A2V3J286_9FLOR|nr:E3 UFM1-protein ligase 1 [Gracilariopsis chorda]|eukprot:PXF48566.1 E3 UFM1-protein ligase 1 [Gracilariopsis chorda]
MDEIFELQRQLQAAQKTTTTQRLSERNCIELVMKLQSLKLIELIFTRSGKEYLTPAHLIVEIEDELLARGGRVNIIDIPDALNVALNYVEDAMPHVIKEDQSVRLVRGELLTDYYLASLAEEVNDGLASSESGTDDVGAIATRYSLPVDLIREVIQKHEGTIIQSKYDAASGVIRSASSVARQEAAARGLLRAVTAPTSLADIASTWELPQTLIHQIATEMLELGHVAGSIEGRSSRAVFIPEVFVNATIAAVSSAYTSNGFVGFSQLRKFYVQDIPDFVQKNLSGGVVLEECVVSSVLLETITTSASEALQQGSWLDIRSALPIEFPESDVPEVVRRVSAEGTGDSSVKTDTKASRTKRKARTSKNVSTKKETVVYGERYIVSPQLTKLLSDAITEDSVKKAAERAKLIAEKCDVVVSHSATKQVEPEGDISSKKSKSKGKRRGGGGKGDTVSKTLKSGGDDMNVRFPVAIPSQEEAIELVFSNPSCSSAFESDYLESFTDSEELLQVLVEALFGENGLRELYITRAAEAIVNLERERATAKLNAERELLASMERIEMYNKSAESLPEEEMVALSKANVVDQHCIDCLCRIMHSVARSTGVVFESLLRATKLSSKREKLETLRGVVDKLPPTLQSILRNFISTVSSKDTGTIETFLNLYDANFIVLDLPERRPLDNKRERNVLAKSRAELISTLDTDDVSISPLRALQIGVVLSHAKVSGGSVVSIPEPMTFECSKAIEDQAKAGETGEALRRLRMVVEAATNGGEDSKVSGGEEYLESLQSLRDTIR